MRIISTERDYYDGVMSLGIDQSLVYSRDRAELIDSFIPKQVLELYSLFPYLSNRGKCPPLEKRIIGFCGSLYPCIRINDTNCYSFGELVRIGEELIGQEKEDFFRTINCRFYGGSKLSTCLSGPLEGRDSIFHDLGVPIFSMRYRSTKKGNLVINPLLREENFQGLIDSYTCYMRVSEYLGGVLGSRREVRGNTGTDEDIRNSRGFDEQSFKTLSPGKKAKRRYKPTQ